MTGTIAEPGVYEIEAATYHADPCATPSLSSSGARTIISECPARYWADRQNPPAPTEALTIGSAAHEWLLEGDTWPQRHVVLPEDFNGRTKDGKAQLAAIEDAGKRAITAEQFDTIKSAVTVLRDHPLAGPAFAAGKSEVTLVWRDEEFGFLCRARIDRFNPAGIVVPDYKTTRSAHPDYLQKAMYELGYHQQAEWYLAGIRALGLIETPLFLFAFQEKVAPYIVTCATPSDVALQWAAIQNRKAREIFAKCIETGTWPAYSDDVLTLDLPPWAEGKLQRKSESGGFEIAA